MSDRKDSAKPQSVIRKLYDLGSRFEIAAERAIAHIVRKLRKR